MPRYRFTGDTPVTVPDLARYEDNPVKPGEEFDTDVTINNSTFVLVSQGPQTISKPQESET